MSIRIRDARPSDLTDIDRIYDHYVDHAMHGRGIGGALLAHLLERARGGGYHTVLAGISADQGPSVRLHAKFGFVEIGRMREVGRKFDRWLDVVFMQRFLGP